MQPCIVYFSARIFHWINYLCPAQPGLQSVQPVHRSVHFTQLAGHLEWPLEQPVNDLQHKKRKYKRNNRSDNSYNINDKHDKNMLRNYHTSDMYGQAAEHYSPTSTNLFIFSAKMIGGSCSSWYIRSRAVCCGMHRAIGPQSCKLSTQTPIYQSNDHCPPTC